MSLKPSLEAAALRIAETIDKMMLVPRHQQPGPDVTAHLITQALRDAVTMENASCEAIAQARADNLQAHGRELQAEACYAVAAKIRMRRLEPATADAQRVF